MFVSLSADTNPDFGPRTHQGTVVLPESLVEVRSFAEASRTCREYIRENQLGGGNWTGGAIFDQTKLESITPD